MNIGKMRDRIIVHKKKSEIIDSNTVDTYPEIMRVWGRVIPNTGRKFFELAAVGAEKVITVVVRYNPSIKEDCRLTIDGIMYRIESVVDIDNRHKYMEIKCEAVVDG